jgi:uncharacterized protein YcbK (DUF882 family)
MTTTRRLVLLGPLALAAPAAASTDTWLWLTNPAGDEVRRVYRRGTAWDAAALGAIAVMLRDRGAAESLAIDPRLIEILGALQAGLGFRAPFLVTSGYRAPETNRRLEGAAQRSLHLAGMAADISMAGVSPRQIAELALKLGAGGVGLYPSAGFVHIDSGEVRRWTN